MLEIVTETLKTKVGAYSGDKQSGLMTQRIKLARLEHCIFMLERHLEKV